MAENRPRTLEEHQAVVAKVADLAEALPTDAIRELDMPIATSIDEWLAVILAARENYEPLSKVGVTHAMIDHFEKLVFSLSSGQTIWQMERRGGRNEETAAMIDEAEKLRNYLTDAAELALRNNLEGQRRLATIREGDGIPDMVSDLDLFTLLLTEARPLFKAICINSDEQANKAAGMRDSLRKGLAEEDIAKALSGSKEMRDRIYTLAKEKQQEIRMFASFAFRGDKTNKRRGLFASSYLRKRDRRARAKAAAAATTTQD
jgi:hypothetical protein